MEADVSLLTQTIFYIWRVRTTICMSGWKTICVLFRIPLHRMQEALPAGRFCRCHNSFIVNLSYIREITRTEVRLNNGKRFRSAAIIPAACKTRSPVFKPRITFFFFCQPQGGLQAKHASGAADIQNSTVFFAVSSIRRIPYPWAAASALSVSGLPLLSLLTSPAYGFSQRIAR